MKQRFHCVAFSLASVLVLAATVSSWAQNRPAPQLLDPKACADEQRLRPPSTGNAPQSPGSPNQTLSEKLEQTEGVLCPPAGVDPDIGLAPPGGGKTPVIPPPGSPGGDPTVRPK